MFFTLQQVKDANKAIGHHYFDRGTMRFFKSRIVKRVFTNGDRMFLITSEKGPSNVRAYSVREVKENGAVETAKDIGEFQAFATLAQAKAALKRAGCRYL